SGSGPVGPSLLAVAEPGRVEEKIDALTIPTTEERAEDSTPVIEPLVPLTTDTTTSSADAILSSDILGRSGFETVIPVLFDGKVFQLFDVSSIAKKSASYFQANDSQDKPTGVFLETSFEDEISAQQFYEFLKNKTRVYLDLSVNESNSFGSRSFYVNHVKKPNEAFLVVREGKYVYAYAYQKAYHSRIKTLISLLSAAIL
ncbi:MAG: hypothetical protein AAB592_04670, partial [Patescibacteria group bacterium]